MSKGKKAANTSGDALNRRDFIKTSALLGTGAIAATQFPWLIDSFGGNGRREIKPTAEYTLARPENAIYSVCLNCHVRCPIKVKNVEGTVVKIDGSPYAAKTLLPNIPYETSPAEAAIIDGKLCPKGQASVQILYDPYRVRKVLKRVGLRGSGQWQTIDFNQAVDEIVNGGDLFGEGPVPALKDIFTLRDPGVAKAMAEDVDIIRKKKMTVADFKKKHAANLGVLIDPEHPDLGPKNNQFVFLAGRIQHGRKELGKRFTNDSFGSVNFFEHTTICEQSHHIATKEMTLDPEGKAKEHFKPDFLNSEFVIFWGTGYTEANFGSTAMAELCSRALVERNFKFAAVDPRLSKTAAKAWRWLPIKPGADAALALAMIRWIIENQRYNQKYLENANQDAAKADGETTSTDATHLVRTDELKLLRAEDIGLEVPAPEEGEKKPDYYVVMTEEGLRHHDEAEHGLLEVDTTIQGIPVKSVFTLIKERAQEKTLDEYAEITGITVSHIEEVAAEFTSHGKKVGIDSYRGPVQHTNGYYAQQAILTLNLLVGGVDWKGGLTVDGGHWHELGDKDGQPYNLAKELHPGKIKSFGVTLTREKSKYDESTLFDSDGGFPAKRPWYPFSSNVYQEVIPAAGAAYPYPIKALWLHKGTPVLSTPGGQAQIEILKDTSKIPLFIVDDVVVGETSMFADYIFPDLTYLERWGTPHDNPQPSVKTSAIRQPAAVPIPEVVLVDGEEMPISMEAVMIAIGKKLGLPSFGKGGFGEGGDFNRPEDYFLRMAANVAFGDKKDGSDAVPGATAEEMEVFRQARRHLPAAVFDEAKWQASVGPDLWPKVVYVLNRGGRFEPFEKSHEGDYMGHKYGKPFHLFVERVAKAKDPMTGQRFDGIARYDPPMHSSGEPLEQDEFEFHLITFKEIHGGHSRTIPTYWTNIALMPENSVLINKLDGDRLGIDDGDTVKLVSASNPDGIWPIGNGRDRPVAGKAKLIEGIRPGVVAVSWHYGHWAYGSSDVEIDGERIKGDERRSKGLCPNAAMLLDKHTKTACLTDPIGASASFYDTKVNLVKV